MKFSGIIPLFLLSILLLGYGQITTAQTTPDTTVYVVAQAMPRFPGGTEAQIQFLSSHLHFPEKALQHHIAGKVYVTFVVERDGSISHIRVLKGLGYGCDSAAVRAVAEMPRWEPGMTNGKPVRVRYTLPFNFNSQSTEKKKVYSHVDAYPQFDTRNIGGLKGYLQDNLRYPVNVLKDSIIDTVRVFFVVEPNDSVTQVTVRKDSSQWNACDYEAMRIVKTLPVKAPAYLNHQPVAVRLYIPVVFDYRQLDTTSSTLVQTTVHRKTFSYYCQSVEHVPMIVEKMPSFPGGPTNLMRYLATHIHYPKEAKRKKQQGKVYIHFIVEKDGRITHIHVVKGASPSLDAEAVRVIKEMPRWNPGYQKGKPVRVGFNLPVKFKL